MAVTLYETLSKILIAKKAIHSTGILGGFTPNLFSNTDAFEILIEAIKASPYTFAQDLFFGADIAAETFYENSKYVLKDKQQPYSSQELLEYYRTLRTVYHAFYLEDPYQEDDWKSWKTITSELGPTSLIVGDSMFGTSLDRLSKAIDEKVCNAIAIKPNAIGTISETIQFIQTARKAGWQIVVSQRSGETNDDFIADFAVGVGANYTKFGPPQRGERVAKYNRLLQIDSYLQLREQAQPAVTPTPVPPPPTEA
jgi:enolase